MHLLKPAFAYFGLVFGMGFLLGVSRILVLVPRVGDRMAELLELPLMVFATFLAARWTVRRHIDLRTKARLLGVGSFALGLMLLADCGVGLWLRGLSPAESLFARDPVSGSAYYLSLLLFAAMPWLYRRRRTVPASGTA